MAPGSKSRLAKAAGAEPARQMKDEKLHTVVARSTFGSQNVQNTSASEHFEKLRCRKSARFCGAKHVKSECTRHTRSGPLMVVMMSKKCTPFLREAYLEVKSGKARQSWTTFGSCDVEKVHAVVARITCASQNVEKHPRVGTILEADRSKVQDVVARSTLEVKMHILELQMSKKWTALRREAHFQVETVKSCALSASVTVSVN